MRTTKEKIRVADYAALPAGSGQVIKIENEEIALFRLTNGEVKAIENKSPHPKGGTLAAGMLSGEFIYCPVYDWKISLQDGRVQAPESGKVKTYNIEVEGDSVYLVR
ncbi:nitrite reductase (NAD(P)H) small subunit [Bacillus canaveralius]|uniref:Nitrite reductase (NAD(P)H) small subunit n=1 Tax=Bacillus canaveralius TaxID=1403243 RepID=A0A2N5GM17_9BACI|nr:MULTISPECIES: nitrite reductase small subunit NirD [Bacillus]PLR82910.1 nitrite reductase (NAD(P)H) small subunit [Bacillus canaveralius]PLR85279.1 nitrite reductase (NAD(P)H) small subunit [Bacillus sp. V33-4]PLR97085.1 nitrite reductase (NAD(P)H) small subunit [Bacillus canaveralius]RSK55515.1 nitrite reductase small subunit NirD [Bacillus canaveralius]